MIVISILADLTLNGDWTSFMTTITTVFTSVVSWITSFISSLTEHPLTLALFGMLIVSAAIGFTFKLLRGV